MTSFVDRDRLAHLMEAFDDLQKEAAQLLNKHEYRPSADSVAAQELASYPNSESVLTAYAQADLLVEALSEHIVAFTRSSIEPALAMAPWACVRAAIESSALASWLLDPAINASERVSRSFAFRYEGLDQQAKFARAVGDQEALEVTLRRIEVVEQKAISLGFGQVLGKKGNRIGIGQVMPAVTALAGQALDEEGTYRLLSAVTHAHPWALQQVGFLQVIEGLESPVKTVALKKAAKPICFRYLSLNAAESFSRPIIYKPDCSVGTPYLLRRKCSTMPQRSVDWPRCSTHLSRTLSLHRLTQGLQRTPDGAAESQQRCCDSNSGRNVITMRA